MSDFRHPYMKYEGSPLWNVLDKAMDDLVENTDIKETTRREYIIGYLIECIAKNIPCSRDWSSRDCQ